jgi:hypothetical protein
VPEGVLRDAVVAFVDGGGAELDDGECVEHRGGASCSLSSIVVLSPANGSEAATFTFLRNASPWSPSQDV